VVSIDKQTAVKMYDKVQKYWKKYIEQLKTDVGGYCNTPVETQNLASLQEKIKFIQEDRYGGGGKRGAE